MACVFTARFTRYTKATCERRLSRSTHINAVDFPTAYARARDMLDGMRHVDPASEYEIVSLGTTDYRGVDCEGGLHLWETAEEWDVRDARAATEGAFK